MAERLYIDGVDVFATFGAYPTEVSGLLTWATFKTIQTTDWPDEDGVEASLSNPKLNAASHTLNVVVRNNKIGDFMEFIYSSHQHSFQIPSIGYDKKLRIVGCSDMDAARSLGMVTLLLSEDTPLEGYTYQNPLSTIGQAHLKGIFRLDGRDITDYGCGLLVGANKAFRSYPNIKEGLVQSTSDTNGIIADKGASILGQSRQVKVSLLLRASTIEEFWRNYNALYYDITQPGARELELVGEIPVECYYQSMNIQAFSAPRFAGDIVWMKLGITFSTTQPICVLMAEGDELIISEDLLNNILIR